LAQSITHPPLRANACLKLVRQLTSLPIFWLHGAHSYAVRYTEPTPTRFKDFWRGEG
jgi:hypothetical protein